MKLDKGPNSTATNFERQASCADSTASRVPPTKPHVAYKVIYGESAARRALRDTCNAAFPPTHSSLQQPTTKRKLSEAWFLSSVGVRMRGMACACWRRIPTGRNNASYRLRMSRAAPLIQNR